MDISKMIKIKQHRIDSLANAFRENFEKKTGKIIGTGNNFNYEEIINFYGGKVEYAELGNNLREKAYIQKTKEADFDFKMVIDRMTAEKLKTPDNIGNWNLFLMTLFYHVIMASEKFDSMEDGQIVYPDEQMVKKVLDSVKQNQDSSVDLAEGHIL